ncbi:hypothetical protein COCCADRAFT_87139, partial [Bipolaris zeicola 26-R-13]
RSSFSHCCSSLSRFFFVMEQVAAPHLLLWLLESLRHPLLGAQTSSHVIAWYSPRLARDHVHSCQSTADNYIDSIPNSKCPKLLL